jgi:phage terminase large subunit-like protein
VDFAIHFVEPFKSKKEAQKAVDFAKQLQPWQEFIILHGC